MTSSVGTPSVFKACQNSYPWGVGTSESRSPWSTSVGVLTFLMKVIGEELPEPSMAPTLGEHTDKVLADVLEYDKDKIAALRQAGVLG